MGALAEAKRLILWNPLGKIQDWGTRVEGVFTGYNLSTLCTAISNMLIIFVLWQIPYDHSLIVVPHIVEK